MSESVTDRDLDASTGPRRWAAPLTEAAAYVLTIALVSWPGPLHFATRIVGASDDARYYTWLGWRLGQLIQSGNVLPTRIPDVIVPFGLDLRLLDGLLPSYVSGLWNLVLGPIASFNAAMVTGTVLNLLAARHLARRLSRRRVVGVIAAVAFVTAPPIALGVQQGLLSLYWAFSVPLLLADALDVASGRSRVRPIRLAILLLVAYLCSVYFLVFGGLLYVVVVGITAARDRDWSIPRRTAAAGVAVAVLLLPVIVPRLAFDRAERAGGGNNQLLRDSELFSADPVSLLAQPSRSTFLVPRPDVVDRSILKLFDPTKSLEFTLYPGVVLLVGFVVFAMRKGRLRLPLVASAGLLLVLALGPSLRLGGDFVWERGGEAVSFLPYRVLLMIPGLGALRGPDRVAYVLVAVLAAGTAIALDRVLGARSRRFGAVTVGVIGVLLMTNMLVPLPTTTLNATRASERALREVARTARDGDTVMSVPGDCDPTFASYQVFHQTPIVGCAGSFAANPWRSKIVAYSRSDAFAKLRCDRKLYGRLPTTRDPAAPLDAADLRRLRRDYGVRFLLVDRSRLGTEACAKVAAALPLLAGYRSLGGDGLEVIDLGRRP